MVHPYLLENSTLEASDRLGLKKDASRLQLGRYPHGRFGCRRSEIAHEFMHFRVAGYLGPRLTTFGSLTYEFDGSWIWLSVEGVDPVEES